MNLPNKLTLLRVILVPFVVGVLLFPRDIPHSWLIAGILFGIAAYTDRLDGKIARRDHLITDFGKFMDPLADKVLVVSVLCCLINNVERFQRLQVRDLHSVGTCSTQLHRNICHEVDDVLGLSCKSLSEYLILSGNSYRTCIL